MSIFQRRAPGKPMPNRFSAPVARMSGVYLASLLIFTSTLGQAAETPDAVLEWREAAALTLERHPTLVAFGHQLKAQEGRLLQAGLKPNPELTATIEDAFGSGSYQNADSAESTLSISWLLEGQQRKKRLDAAETQTNLLEVERDIKRLDAVAETARLYVTAMALQARERQIEQAITFAREALGAIQKRVSAANSPAAELARARVELSHLLLEEEDVEHQRLVTHRQLAAQWGSSEVSFSQVENRLENVPTVNDYAQLQVRLRQNPRLEYFSTQARIEESQLALIKAQARSQWRVSAGIKHLAATDDQALVAGVSVPLAVFDRQQGRIAESRALAERNHAEHNAEIHRLDTALFAVHQELLHSLHKISAYRNDILPALEQILKETRRAYDLGRYSYLEWQSVQRDYLAAQNQLIDASVTAHLNAIEIERLSGVPPHAPPNEE